MTVGCEPVVVHGRPCDLPGCAASTDPSLSLCPPPPPVNDREERTLRFIGMDVHRDWCEVAIAEAGRVWAAGRVKAEPESLALFARSLAPDDEVVLEASFGAARIAEIIRPHVARVVIADPRRLAKADSRKTDRRDARRLAELLPRGFSTRSGPLTRPPPRFAAWSRGGRASSRRGRRQRTRSMPPSPATCCRGRR